VLPSTCLDSEINAVHRRLLSPILPGPYGRLLARPGAPAFVIAGWFGRHPRACMSLGLLLLVRGETGSFATGGAVAAAALLPMAVSGPLWSAAMDAHGQRRCLAIGLVATAVVGALLLLAVLGGAPLGLWFVLAAALGAVVPDIGSAVRARWSALVGEDERTGAFALESVSDETVFVVAPPLVTALAAAVAPAAGFAAALVLGLLGTGALLLARGTEPAVRDRPPRRTGRAVLPPAAILPPTLAAVAFGVVLGSFDVAAVGRAESAGTAALAGLIIAVIGAAMGAGALACGSRRWTATVRTRFASGAIGVAVTAPLIPLLAPSLPLLLLATVALGLAAGVTVASNFALVEQRAPRERVTELVAYPAAASGIGVTAGAALAGLALDGGGVVAAFTVTAAAGVLVALLAVAGEAVLARAPRRALRPEGSAA
jgi:MFS family permease